MPPCRGGWSPAWLLPLGQAFPTSGLQFLGCKAAPPKVHTQRVLEPFKLALPYGVPEFHKWTGDWDNDGSLIEQHLYLGNWNTSHTCCCDYKEDYLCTQEELRCDSQIQPLLHQSPKLFQLASLSVRRLRIILTSLCLWGIKPLCPASTSSITRLQVNHLFTLYPVLGACQWGGSHARAPGSLLHPLAGVGVGVVVVELVLCPTFKLSLHNTGSHFISYLGVLFSEEL